MRFQNKLILNHPLCQIYQEESAYRVLITMSKGGVVEHEPFPGDQRGLVAAMSLAVDVLAGKIWLSHVDRQSEAPQKPATVLLEKKHGKI